MTASAQAEVLHYDSTVTPNRVSVAQSQSFGEFETPDEWPPAKQCVIVKMQLGRRRASAL
jgi:hypothetical protein